MGTQPLFVAVSGPPASGKSTIAAPLAVELRMPLIAKDAVKDALMRTLGVDDVDASRRLGRAAVQVMLSVAATSPVGAVLDCNFHRSLAGDELRALPGPVIEVFCRCDRELAAARYAARARSRHAGHFDRIRSLEDLWNPDVSEPVAGGWPVIEIDTDSPIDSSTVADQVRACRVEGAVPDSGRCGHR